jgi:arylformamidase
MVIYKNYDQEALDLQYNNRTKVPDFTQIVAGWKQRSEALRQSASLYPDLRYGAHERERLDIFPANMPNSPVLVFFHGGYWQAMEKDVFHFIVAGFLEHQVTVAMVNYPLAPEVTMDDIVSSCRRAMVWLYDHVVAFNGSPPRIYVSGHSAGGHLVAMLAATDWKQLGAQLPHDLIKGGCAISGLFDLTPIRLSYLNDVLGLDAATVQRNSPVDLVPNYQGRLIVAVGELESDEYHAQSRGLVRAWSEAKWSLRYLPVAGANHFSILEQFVTDRGALNKAILEQMQVTGNSLGKSINTGSRFGI